MSKNCYKLDGRSLYKIKYVFVDTKEHFYIRHSKRYGIRLRSIREFKKDGTDVRLIFCSVLKKDNPAFHRMLKDIRNSALTSGYTDYNAFCSLLQNIVVVA